MSVLIYGRWMTNRLLMNSCYRVVNLRNFQSPTQERRGKYKGTYQARESWTRYIEATVFLYGEIVSTLASNNWWKCRLVTERHSLARHGAVCEPGWPPGLSLLPLPLSFTSLPISCSKSPFPYDNSKHATCTQHLIAWPNISIRALGAESEVIKPITYLDRHDRSVPYQHPGPGNRSSHDKKESANTANIAFHMTTTSYRKVTLSLGSTMILVRILCLN